MHGTLRNIALAIGVISAAALSPSANAQDRTIRVGEVNLSFYAVVGAIVQEVLEQDGYKVEVTAGSHGDSFPKLGAGEVDILAAAWLPDGHALLYAKVKDVTFIIGGLEEPKGIYGKGDTAVLLGHEKLKGKLAPETLERLANIKLSVDAVTEMDLWVNVDGLTPRDAAKRWLAANPLRKG